MSLGSLVMAGRDSWDTIDPLRHCGWLTYSHSISFVVLE